MKLYLVNVPEPYGDTIQFNISDQILQARQVPDIIHLFAKNYQAFIFGIQTSLHFEKKSPYCHLGIWVQKSVGKNSELSVSLIREFALQNELVDIKVCDVDNVWCGFKLVVPLAKK